jgi:hypothetical protein
MPDVSIKINKAQTNESKIRLIALFTLIIAIIYLLTSSIVLPIFLLIDFGLRGFNLGHLSPLGFAADKLVKAFNLPIKFIYLPPKRFAARIGFLFAATILILQIAGINTVIVTSVLAFFAFLESFLSICAGCYVYDFLIKLKILR